MKLELEVSVRLALPHTNMVKKSHAMIAATGMIGAICYIFVEESKVLYLSIKNKIYRNGLPFLELLFIFLLILYFIYFVDQLLV